MNHFESNNNAERVTESPEPGSLFMETLDSARGERGVQQVEMYLITGASEHLTAASGTLGTVLDHANTPRSAADVITAKNQILTSERIASLPTLPGNISIQGEQKRLQEITQRLNATRALRVEDMKRKRSSSLPKAYLVAHGGTFKLKRDLLEDDLKFLSDPTRIDADTTDAAVIPQEREAVFTAYRNILAELVSLNPPEYERRYTGKYGSVLAPKAILEHACRNKSDIKGASKFALLTALTGLLALWGIKDFRNKTLSLGSMGLLGSVMLLAKSGKKYDFVKTNYFAELSRDGLNETMIKKLQSLSSVKMRYLIKTIEAETGPGKTVSRTVVDRLISPTRKRAGQVVPDPQKAIPIAIAEFFLGKSAGGSAKVLRGIAATARDRNRGLISEFAKANANHQKIAQELAELQQQNGQPSTP